jgi:hypothetical protein
VLRGRLYVAGGMRTDMAVRDRIDHVLRAAAAGDTLAVYSAAVADIQRAATTAQNKQSASSASAGAAVVQWRRERVAPDARGATPGPPPSLTAFVCVADEPRAQLLLHGGEAGGTPFVDGVITQNATWALRLDDANGALRWVQLRPRGELSPRAQGAAGALVGRTLYVHGGDTGKGVHGELHALDLSDDDAALTWRRVAVRSSASTTPAPRGFHQLVRLHGGDDDDATLACFGGTENLTRADAPLSPADARYFTDLLLFDVRRAKWRHARMFGSEKSALPASGRKGGRAQHACWPLRAADGDVSLALYGGYAVGPRCYGDLRAFDVTAGEWHAYDWSCDDSEGGAVGAGCDAAACVPRCRCGHSATPLDASGAVVAVWGGAMDMTPRRQLLVFTLAPPPAPAPAPPARAAAAAAAAAAAPPPAEHTASAAAEPVLHPLRPRPPPEIQARTDAHVAETLAPLPAIEARMHAALRDERTMFQAEAAAREWLARAFRDDAEPGTEVGDSQRAVMPAALAFEASHPAAHRSQRFSVRVSTAHFILGFVCRHSGRLGEARAEYEAAIAAMEPLPRPLTPEERCRLGESHFSHAMLCRTIAAGDERAFLEHMRAGTRPGLTTDCWSGMHADWSDAELLREYGVGHMTEEAL